MIYLLLKILLLTLGIIGFGYLLFLIIVGLLLELFFKYIIKFRK